jgi:TatD DNase family protein
MLVDCHAHLQDPDFDSDREAVLARAHAAGVGTVLVVGEGPEDNRLLESVCADYSGEVRLHPCFGFHPDRFSDDAKLPTREEVDAWIGQVRAAAQSLAAVGEVGLDRWVAKSSDRREAQAKFLEEAAALAIGLDLPLNVHSRSAGHYTLDLLRAAGAKQVLMHAFDGKASHATRAAEEGFVFSIPPSVARSNQKQKLIRALPLESLVLESDSPILGPDKDKRNEPANLVVARDWIARIQGVSPDEVASTTTENARRLFPILTTVS